MISHLRLTHVAAALSLSLFATHCPTLQAQSLGVSTQGVTGGLVIPSAQVLPTGTLAFTHGNYQEPQIGTYATQQNFSFGVGLLHYLELFGRFANYNNPHPDSTFLNGVSDLSPNIKVQLPPHWDRGPKVAVSMNASAGGAVNFQIKQLFL